MIDLIQKRDSKIAQLEEATRSLKPNGFALDKAEQEYKEALSKKALELRDQGMAGTLMDKVIYGLPSISILRFKRDCAKTVYEANQEAINTMKLQIKIYEADIAREWGSTK